jgi:hypothetical protein
MLFHFMILQLLPDDGQRTRPKHVVEAINSAYKKCCVCSDKDLNIRPYTQWDDDGEIYNVYCLLQVTCPVSNQIC